MYRDWMEGDAAGGKAGRLGAAVTGICVAVPVTTGAAARVGATVAGSGTAVALTAGAADAGGKVAMVGMAGEPVLHAIMESRIAAPPSRVLN